MNQKGIIPLPIILGILVTILAGVFIYFKQSRSPSDFQDNQKQATASGTVTTN